VKYQVSFTRENNKLLSHVLRLPLLELHNLIKSTQMCCCMMETSLVSPQKSLVTFRNLWQSLENVRKRLSSLRNNFGKYSEIFGRWSEIFGKSSKHCYKYVTLYNKQNITYLLMFNSISHLFTAFTCAISSWTLAGTIHIHVQVCNILYLS